MNTINNIYYRINLTNIMLMLNICMIIYIIYVAGYHLSEHTHINNEDNKELSNINNIMVQS